MRRNYPEFFYGFPLITLGIGAVIPNLILTVSGSDTDSFKFENPVFGAAFFGSLFFVIYMGFILSRRYKRLSELCNSSLKALCLLTFAVGFVAAVLSSLYTMLPLPALLLKMVAALVGIGAMILLAMKGMGDNENT